MSYTVHDEPDYARTYDEDDTVTVRRGDLRAVLDVGTMSMDFASGFLVEEQVEALRKMAGLLGIDPIVVTPANFVCKYTGEHEWRTMRPLGHLRPDPAADAAEADEADDVQRLIEAKASGDPDAVHAAAMALRQARTVRRNQPRWLPDWVDGEPVAEWCWRCGARQEIAQ